MKIKSRTVFFLLLLLFLPQLVLSQDPYRTTRSLEIQRAIGHVAQAEYYTRMALRSLEASEKAGRAPFFDYKKAREDLGRILDEFKFYLSGDGSPARASAIPVVIDGRYFAESIKEYLLKAKHSEPEAAVKLPLRRAEEAKGKVEGPEPEVPVEKFTEQELEGKAEERRGGFGKKTDVVLPRPSPKALGDQSQRERIGEILKKGL